MLYKGFSLIEMMVTLVIVSIGMLALGSFYASGIRAEGSSLRRLAAVHMAEQVLEAWQNNNVLPAPDCTLLATGNPAGVLVLNTPITSCIPNSGVSSPFDIVAREANALAPTPNGHPLYAGPVGGSPAMGNLYRDQAAPAVNPVQVRKVRVSWQQDGVVKQILLTHITRR